ncbi:MAG: glycerophosphodiester phosphodiesterase family protein [Candidatus Hermodarchaeota archaeon]|nr:glycerophosphodiester phosphodiesterase family protein [Candidatus Hermodarchaeota archaeon]
MVKVIAHRGSGIGPHENTLTGFLKSISWGVDCIECDLRSSRDGAIILLHDFSLERLAHRSELVAEKTLSELKALEIGDGEKIPTLTEFLELVAPYKEFQINLDVKVIGIEAQILGRIEDAELLDRTMISSFIQPVLTKVRKLNDEIPTALLYEYDLQDPVNLAKTLGCTAINPQLHFIDEQLISTCHREGLEINPWLINEREDMERFISYGVDGIITDYPPRLLRILNR